MSLNRLMGKQTLVHPHNGILLSNKKERTSDTCKNMDKSQMHNAKWKKPNSKGYITYDSIYMAVFKKENLQEQKVKVKGKDDFKEGLPDLANKNTGQTQLNLNFR